MSNGKTKYDIEMTKCHLYAMQVSPLTTDTTAISPELADAVAVAVTY
jgi:hypothetical protein